MEMLTMTGFRGGGAPEDNAPERFLDVLIKINFNSLRFLFSLLICDLKFKVKKSCEYLSRISHFNQRYAELSFSTVRVLNKKFAFTLSEVLITLGIIGIIAAMTLPSLIAKYQEKHWQVAYKKAYSSISQAFLRMQQDGEFIDITPESVDSNGVYYTSAIGENFKIISRYFNTVKTCFNKDKEDCWVCEEGQEGRGEAPEWKGCNKSAYAFVDYSGIAWALYNNNEYPIIVDVNGKNRPNKLGKDRFVLLFTSNNDNTNKYSDNVNTISPRIDMLSKDRWCPEGNCLYQTWILK